MSLHTASPSQGWLKLPASTTCARLQWWSRKSRTNSVGGAAFCSKGVRVSLLCAVHSTCPPPPLGDASCWLQSQSAHNTPPRGLALPSTLKTSPHHTTTAVTPCTPLRCEPTCSGGPWSCQPPPPRPPKPPLPPARPPPLPPKPPTLPAPLGGRILCQACQACCRCCCCQKAAAATAAAAVLLLPALACCL